MVNPSLQVKQKHKSQVKQSPESIWIDPSTGLPSNRGSVSNRSSSCLIENSVLNSSFKESKAFSSFYFILNKI